MCGANRGTQSPGASKVALLDPEQVLFEPRLVGDASQALARFELFFGVVVEAGATGGPRRQEAGLDVAGPQRAIPLQSFEGVPKVAPVQGGAGRAHLDFGVLGKEAPAAPP